VLRTLAPPLRRRLIGLALSALLATQWLALVHSVSGHGRASASSAAAQMQPATPAEGLSSLVLGHVDGSAFCQLLDHCLLGGASAPVVLDHDHPVAAQSAWPAVAALACSSCTTSYLARAPPVRVSMHQG
jgi:hypothetical protein